MLKSNVMDLLATGRIPADVRLGAAIYAAILREIQQKGDQAGFVKMERGKFNDIPLGLTAAVASASRPCREGS